jgi:hypothetical protein
MDALGIPQDNLLVRHEAPRERRALWTGPDDLGTFSLFAGHEDGYAAARSRQCRSPGSTRAVGAALARP